MQRDEAGQFSEDGATAHLFCGEGPCPRLSIELKPLLVLLAEDLIPLFTELLLDLFRFFAELLPDPFHLF